MVRVSGNPDAMRNTLLDRLTRIDPNVGMIMTMKTFDALQTYSGC